MTMNMPVLINDTLVQEIAAIGELRRPAEACGVLLPLPWKGKRVFEMPNRSKTPQDHFLMNSSDIVMTLEQWAIENPDEAVWENITIWHTHPSGGVGPSSTDMACRTIECGNLVVSLCGDGPKATWF